MVTLSSASEQERSFWARGYVDRTQRQSGKIMQSLHNVELVDIVKIYWDVNLSTKILVSQC